MRSFSFYRTMDELDSEIFSYSVSDMKAVGFDGSEYPTEVNGGSGTIDDGNGGRTISKYGMTVTGILAVSGCGSLFSEDGLVSPDTALGIAAICSSSVSGRREAFPIADIRSDTDSVSEPFSVPIEGGAYREKFLLSVVLYIKSPSAADRSRGLMSGMLLGTFGSCEFRIGSEKFLFPVHEVEIPGKPLWWVRCDWTSVEEDPFSSEYVCIVFNKAHGSYPLIDETGKKFSKAMLAEVMCASMQIIIEKIRLSPDEWNRVVSDSTLPNDSIAFVIQYLRNTHSWDFSSPESLSVSIHDYVYGYMGLRS